MLKVQFELWSQCLSEVNNKMFDLSEKVGHNRCCEKFKPYQNL